MVTVIIQIRYAYSQSKADKASMDPGFLGYFNKMTIVVPVQMISATFQEICNGPRRIRKITAVGIVKRINRHRAVVDHETVKVSIHIIIKKRNLGCVSRNIESVCSCRF